MYQMEKSTAEMRVVMRAAKTWKSRVNATIWDVRSRLGSLCLAVPLAWLADNDRPGAARPCVYRLWSAVFADTAPPKEN